MSNPPSWLMSVGLVLTAWGVATGGQLPPVADPGPCMRPRKQSAPVGLRGYRRFFANDSLIGRPVPCSREDKICFRHNLFFNSAENICDQVGGGHDTQCDLRPDRTKFEKGGRLLGVCKTYEDPCPGYRMAFDGRCYRREVVRDVLCGCGAKPVRHFVAGVECRSAPAAPIRVQQPEGDGRCLVPDLRFPDIEREAFFRNPFTNLQGFRGYRLGISFRENNPWLRCSAAQAACFARGRVRVGGAEGCHQLLQRGPCAAGHVVAMSVDAAAEGRAEALCVHARGGCPSGHKRMLFDGQCHEDWRINIEAPGQAVWNQYGHFTFIPRGFHIGFLPKKENGLCQVGNNAVAPGLSERRPNPPCGANNQGQCDLYEVESEAPMPDL